MARYEYYEDIDKVTLHWLRSKYNYQQDFKTAIPLWVKKRYKAGKFRRIKSRDVPTVIRLSDNGIVGYRVPAKLVDESLAHIQKLEEWVEKYGSTFPTTEDPKRGLLCVRRYQEWTAYRETGSAPQTSADYKNDGEKARIFMEYSKSLWNCERKWFPKHHLSRIYRDLSLFGRVTKPMCDLWMGCAVNVCVDEKGVETLPHRDVKGFKKGMSCVCPFGIFTGGGLVLWELGVIVELKRGDLFYFMDHLINHSNEKVYGKRNSVVCFTEDKSWSYVQRRCGFMDRRDEKLKLRIKKYRKEKERRERSKKLNK
jgi:hypothetical protein